MISTAGTYVQGQIAYHYKDDTSIREIPRETPSDQVRFSHIMENYLIEARQDPCTVFPMEALHNYVMKVSSVTSRTATFPAWAASTLSTESGRN